jgi:hypothetical protein
MLDFVIAFKFNDKQSIFFEAIQTLIVQKMEADLIIQLCLPDFQVNLLNFLLIDK